MNPLQEIISNDIRKAGAIPFERFMELALYCPDCGYYEKETDKIGREGDFFTSVSVGSLFGELLAFQFSQWLEELEAGEADAFGAPKFQIIEAAANDGQLARDILCWIQTHRPALAERLEYWIAEPSVRLQQRQKETLSQFGAKTRWISRLDELAESSSPGVQGIVFSNELLDAMPVRRIGWDAANRRWFEWGVTLSGQDFAWTRIQSPDVAIQTPELPGELLNVLPDGFTIEISPAAIKWWQSAALVLRRGKLMAIDYGLTAAELIAPERIHGTLRTYSKHHAGDNLLANPGEQDITAHVNFTAIQAAGESSGLKTEAFVPQEKFLMRIAEQIWKGAADFGEWNPARRRQLQTLVHPEHLGRPFRVLVQSRSGVGASSS